jgi:hypothetical protein
LYIINVSSVTTEITPEGLAVGGQTLDSSYSLGIIDKHSGEVSPTDTKMKCFIN